MAVQIGDISTTTISSSSRVEAWVDGEQIWFESADCPLVGSPESLGSALLIPALAAGRELVIEDGTDEQWLANATRILPLVSEWWGLDNLLNVAAPVSEARSSERSTGLCFTGGVDSFHSLLNDSRRFDAIVQVQGFDIPLSDTVRLRSSEADARDVAEATGVECIVVRTNLRQHSTFNHITWEVTHGGALAAIGHLLAGTIGSLGISSSSQRGTPGAWGTDWRLDHLWSSSRLKIRTLDADLSRMEKLAAIASHPLVRDHMRVCWEHKTKDPNCSQCEKCVRTMIGLAVLGVLDDHQRFDSEHLPSRVDALGPLLSSVQRDEYTQMAAAGVSPDLARAIRDLVKRSAHVGLRWDGVL